MRTVVVAWMTCIMVVHADVSAQVLWREHRAQDPVMTLHALRRESGSARTPAFVAGSTSGRIAVLRHEAPGAAALAWEASSHGAILALDVVRRSDGTDGVAASTERGCVSMFDHEGTELWRRECTFNLSALASVPDLDGDGNDEVVYGGADHRVTCLSGSDGALRWSRLLPTAMEPAFVDRIACAGDRNGDHVSDLLVRSFDGTCRVLSGSDGSDLVPVRQGDPYVSTLLACGDLTGDSLQEFLESGNDGIIRLADGADGTELWRSGPSRAVRATALSIGAAEQRFFAGTADGVVSCYRITHGTPPRVSPLWASERGDICRALALVGDIDGDAIDDPAAGDESGMLRVLSGATGHLLWQWHAPDVIRSLEAIGDWNGDGITELAVSTLDGTLSILSGRGSERSFGTIPPRLQAASPVVDHPLPALPEGDTLATAREVPILLYHDIPPAAVDGTGASPLENFRLQMEYLEREGFTPVTLDHVAEWCEQKRELPAGSVCITFDGQYASHLTHVAPILQAHRLFAVSYVTTDWIGTENHLDWHQLRELEASGVMEIENHSANHPYFTRIAPDSVRAQLEISNEAIRRHLGGKQARHHAYPHGPNSPQARQIASELGFRTATAVAARPVLRQGDLYRLPRFTIGETMDLEHFRAIMDRYKKVQRP